MTMERALFEKIKAANLVAGDAVYAMRAPQGAQGPFIIYQRTSSERWRHLKGPSGMVQATIQIDSYAQSYSEAKEIGLAVERLLDGFRGVVQYGNNSPKDTIRFGGISCQNDVDIFDQTDRPFLYRVSADYLVTYEQS